MRLTTYRTELNKNHHNILVKESSTNYPGLDAITTPRHAVDILNAIFGADRQAEEHLYLIACNTKGRPLGLFEVSHGTVCETICNPREILIKALLCGASLLVVAHNHPSGDCTPSSEDTAAWERLKQATRLVGLTLSDNIIIGKDIFYSYSLQGAL